LGSKRRPVAGRSNLILADTSVWVDHLRRGNRALAELLDSRAVLIHPFVIGELALGELRPRAIILDNLSELPSAGIATHEEVLHFIERRGLFGRGIGYVDVHLLAAVELTSGASLWTYDKRLHRAADYLGVATAPDA
jgi:predicted nucleic acid-binding protein